MGYDCRYCRAKLAGRARTIRRMLAEREAARAWLRGEIPGFDPKPDPWACMWCGEMIHGDRTAAKLHVLRCRENPLVQQITELRVELDGMTRARDRFCHAINEVGRLFWGDDKQCYAPDAVVRRVDRLRVVLAAVADNSDFPEAQTCRACIGNTALALAALRRLPEEKPHEPT